MHNPRNFRIINNIYYLDVTVRCGFLFLKTKTVTLFKTASYWRRLDNGKMISISDDVMCDNSVFAHKALENLNAGNY